MTVLEFYGLYDSHRVSGYPELSFPDPASDAPTETEYPVTTLPDSYYSRRIDLDGVIVQASEGVEAVSMHNAARVVEVMMDVLTEDIGRCLASHSVTVSIEPGTDSDGGAGREFHEIAVKESSVLGTLPGKVYFDIAYELAHRVYVLCLAENDRHEWERLYLEARDTDLLTDANYMSDPEDFFARFSVTFLEQPGTPQLWTGRPMTIDRLAENFPGVFAFLGQIYERYEGEHKVAATLTSERPAMPTATFTPSPTPLPDGYEKEALIALYNSTNGSDWNNNENWLSGEPLDRWYGVSTFGGRVTGLHLGGNGLRGEIPVEIGRLTQLREPLVRGWKPAYGRISGTKWVGLRSLRCWIWV